MESVLNNVAQSLRGELQGVALGHPVTVTGYRVVYEPTSNAGHLPDMSVTVWCAGPKQWLMKECCNGDVTPNLPCLPGAMTAPYGYSPSAIYVDCLGLIGDNFNVERLFGTTVDDLRNRPDNAGLVLGTVTLPSSAIVARHIVLGNGFLLKEDDAGLYYGRSGGVCSGTFLAELVNFTKLHSVGYTFLYRNCYPLPE